MLERIAIIQKLRIRMLDYCTAPAISIATGHGTHVHGQLQDPKYHVRSREKFVDLVAFTFATQFCGIVIPIRFDAITTSQ